MPEPNTYLRSRHLVSTPVAVRRCRCGATVLSGLVGGIPTTVDARPADERRALEQGRWTYRLSRGVLVLREDWGRGLPPDDLILADHRH